MWLAIFAVMLIFCISGLVYLTFGFHRFGLIKNIAKKNKAAAWLVSFAAVALSGGIFLLVNAWSVIVVLIHLFIFWLIADLISAVISKIRRKKPERYYAGAVTLVFTAVYLAFGWYMAHHIVPTRYSFTTDKSIGGSLRIAMFADSHVGITFDGNGFAEQMKRIEAEEPDILIIAGDFVDDDSCNDDMVRACAALGEMHPKYGKFYAFGNHDKGYYQSGRDFTEADLRRELEKNGVTILEDSSVMVADNICVIGRQDAGAPGRAAFSDIKAESEDYSIVIDHQPNDYDAEAGCGADLVLSGHTHGGHLFPAGYIGLLIGANDLVYGTTHREQTDFVVTSGISGWALPFKTDAKSEFVIIDVKS